MTIGLFALQTAIYSALSGDSTLTSTLSCGVYDDTPEESAFPFIVIGEDTTTEYGTADVDGGSTTVTIHVWSQYKGSKEAKNIIDRVHPLLHDSSLSQTGFNLVNMRYEFSDVLRDPDGVTRHGIIRFRAITLGTS